MSDYRGRFLWYELMTNDIEAAKAFYGEVVGWSAKSVEAPMPYTMWNVGESPKAGLFKLPQEAAAMGVPPHWMAYVGTPDVDATVAKAQELGAKVLVPVKEVPSVGRFATLSDPQGVTFSPFTPSEPEAAPLKQADIGEFTWHELVTDDWSSAWSFYETLFGWNKTDSMEMGPMGTYQMWGLGEHTLGGMYNKPADMPAPPHWLYYIHVPDVEAAAKRVTALGGKVINGPVEVPGGDMVIQCMDPQNAAFALHQSKK